MTTALITHADFLDHVTPEGHPERMKRLESILQALKGKPLANYGAPLATDDDLRRAHPQSHIDSVANAVPDEGLMPLDADTWVSPGSLTAARRAVGGALRAVDLVLSGEVRNAFLACRPPGHHAETAKAMGFCLFSTVAIAAKHALDHHGLSRVAILDFDVHHGNGTQDILWDEKRAFFCSSHQSPLWPGTGREDERGAHDTILNIQLAPGSGSAVFRRRMEEDALVGIDAFAPELILISAGFDAHRDDPLAGLNLLEADFAWITHRLCELADQHCQGRVVSCLEGGYDLRALARSTAAHVDVLIERGAA
jgi:acetoin utilization deacetylase AcuC-like enzyme